MVIPESGTLPPPRPPLTDREKRLHERLTKTIDRFEGFGGDVDRAIRQLALEGFDFHALGSDDQARSYVRGVVEGLRHARYLIDPPSQGIA